MAKPHLRELSRLKAATGKFSKSEILKKYISQVIGTKNNAIQILYPGKRGKTRKKPYLHFN